MPVSLFPFQVPEDAWKVEDADEEIFLLYSQLQALEVASNENMDMAGLGFVDPRKGELSVQIDVTAPTPEEYATQSSSSPAQMSKCSKTAVNKNSGKARHPLEVQLFQDPTALQSRKGDTVFFGEQGKHHSRNDTLFPNLSVLSASVHLARLLLSEQRFRPNDAFLPASALPSCHVLELGSGTGLLSIVLGPFAAHYITTDLCSLVPLIRKNQAHNLSPSDLRKVVVADLDWVQLHNTPVSLRPASFPAPARPRDTVLQHRPRKKTRGKASPSNQEPVPDPSPQRSVQLILAVDCIYNPSLIAPFLSTLDHFAALGSSSVPHSESEHPLGSQASSPATVLVVLELRAADVAREFLHGWLALPGKWEIWSVPLLGTRFAVWAGRRTNAEK